ncbi:hypothetical protein RDI58_027216 [Solanum bulbocastanum]|uniref:Uncharacterized protein n=1 Tax=Solanum bulbocastanum TaxID=147425 RepID=A0AAN8Y1M2_SOLBU
MLHLDFKKHIHFFNSSLVHFSNTLTILYNKCNNNNQQVLQSKKATVLQVPHVATNAPTPDPLLNKEDFFAPNPSQMVSYGIKLNINVPLPNRPVESIKLSIRNTTICGQEELDLELRL